MIDAAGKGEKSFEVIGDVALDLFGRHSRVECGDHDDWNVHRGEHVDWHLSNAHSAQDRDDQGDYDAATRTVTVRLGTGANGVTGGSIAISDDCVVNGGNGSITAGTGGIITFDQSHVDNYGQIGAYGGQVNITFECSNVCNTANALIGAQDEASVTDRLGAAWTNLHRGGGDAEDWRSAAKQFAETTDFLAERACSG